MKPTARILTGRGSCKDVLRCLYDLGDFELRIYKLLHRRGLSKTEELMPLLHRDRSTVYRSLQKMVDAGLVVKHTRKLKRGGNFHEYEAVPPEKVRDQINKCIDEWVSNFRSAFEKFDIV